MVKGVVYDMIPKSLFSPEEYKTESRIPSVDVSPASPSRAQPKVVKTLTGVRLVLPEHMSNSIKDIDDPSRRIITLIEKYPFISPSAVLWLVKPVQELLPEKTLIDISVFLYSKHYCREACNLLILNIPFGSVASVICSQFIPRILAESESNALNETEARFDIHESSSFESQLLAVRHQYHESSRTRIKPRPCDRVDLLLTTIISTMITRGQESLAKHVITELKDVTNFFDRTYSERHGNIPAPVFTPESLLIDATMVSQLQKTNSEDLPEVIGSRPLKEFYMKGASDSVRLSILKLLLVLGNFRAFRRMANEDKRFLTSSFVIHNLVGEIHHQCQLSQDFSAIEYLLDYIIQLLIRDSVLYPLDIATLPYLITSKSSAYRLWGAVKPHLKRIPLDSYRTEQTKGMKVAIDKEYQEISQGIIKSNNRKGCEISNENKMKLKRIIEDPASQIQTAWAYSEFLERAIELRVSSVCADLVYESSRSIQDSSLIASAMSTVLWGQKKTELDMSSMSEEEKINYYSNITAENFRFLLLGVSEEVLQPALYFFLHRLNKHFKTSEESDTNKNIPGVILWKLLMALEKSNLVSELSGPVEKELALIISTRPLLEQFQYFRLNCVSTEGVVMALSAHVDRLKYTISPDDDHEISNDINIKFILSSLYIMKQKTSNDLDPEIMSSVMESVYSFASNPESLKNSQSTPNDVLYTEKMLKIIQPSEKTSVDIVRTLAKRSQFQAALYYIKCIGDDIPNEAFYSILTEGSQNYPLVCQSIKRWLESNRNVELPSYVLRNMAIGFAKSRAITDSQSSTRVRAIIHELADRGLSIGARASIVYVDSLLSRAIANGRGSRDRLKWAVSIAKRQNVSKEQINHWLKELEYMRIRRIGYWSTSHDDSARSRSLGKPSKTFISSISLARES